MHNTIFRKTIIAYFVFALLSFIGTASISYHLQMKRTISDTANTMYLQAINISNAYGTMDFTSNDRISSISKQLSLIASASESRIMIINSQNKVIVDTATRSTSTFRTISEFDPIASGNHIYTRGNFYGIMDEECITVIVPITYNLVVRGYVCIHKPMRSLHKALNASFNVNYITMFICIIAAFIFLVTLYKNVQKPLKTVSIAVDEYGKGNLSYRIEKYQNDEIGRLAASLNYMAGRLDELEQSERAFIANVSHDFRSPLTSIKGYLEAILDGTIPVERQEKYLKIIIAETERLTKLTNNILSLNSMESRKNRLNLSSFDINQAIKKTLDTFEGTCKNKGIKFELEFVEQSIPVIGDLDKITQVLYNLVDNAIKFSNNNSTIKIYVSERGEKAFISIKDSGIGIPKDSIDKIWERFYKTDQSRGKDKKGTGLGLSIVKEIIKAHAENIDVISTEGVGTEFIFSLKRDIQDS